MCFRIVDENSFLRIVHLYLKLSCGFRKTIFVSNVYESWPRTESGKKTERKQDSECNPIHFARRASEISARHCVCHSPLCVREYICVCAL